MSYFVFIQNYDSVVGEEAYSKFFVLKINKKIGDYLFHNFEPLSALMDKQYTEERGRHIEFSCYYCQRKNSINLYRKKYADKTMQKVKWNKKVYTTITDLDKAIRLENEICLGYKDKELTMMKNVLEG